ncbi:MAG: CpsD/CapB family tyrosine-protein kinase [Clostridium sp.]|uniref:CpsD/CapB family tyrosine-protein kinase n=1 Tax=Clostridium sp. TaxID=1506 RepID=UPI003F3BAFF1
MLITEREPKSIPSENYRKLRTNVIYSSFDSELKKILVTSSLPGEGKSTTSSNLAMTFSQADKKTILIDCDLRKPSIHKKFNISNMSGLTDYIVEKKDISKYLIKYNENLDILPAGKVSPSPSEMLSSKAMTKLLDDLAEIYDQVIIDSPPVNVVTDAQILATKVDGVIIVVAAGQTKKDSVVMAKESIEKVKGRVLGTVLNKLEVKRDQHYYYYE